METEKEMDAVWDEFGEPIVIKISLLHELRKVAGLLYYEVNIKDTPLADPLNADDDERLLFETVNRLNDQNLAAKSYSTPEPNVLEDVDFDMNASLCIELCSITDKLRYFLIYVFSANSDNVFIMTRSLENDRCTTAAVKNPLLVTAVEFSRYARCLWSAFHCDFIKQLFERAYYDVPSHSLSYMSSGCGSLF